MYDYATVTKQNQIITQIESANENIEKLNNNLEKIDLNISILVILITIILIKNLVRYCLGGKI